MKTTIIIILTVMSTLIISVVEAANGGNKVSTKVEEVYDAGYRTHTRGDNIIMTFIRDNVRVRVHTTSKHAPFFVDYGNKDKEMVIKPGQWAEVYVQTPVNWVWAYAKDADNR